MSAPALPLLVTLGDACGIGPEIVAKAFVQGELQDAVVVGDAAVMRRAFRALGQPMPLASIMPITARLSKRGERMLRYSCGAMPCQLSRAGSMNG